MTAVRDAVSARRLIPPLLRDTEFRRFWAGSTVSMFGDQVSSIAVPLTAVLALHAGAAAMGYLTALAWLPSLLFGMHAGAWVDRRGRRRQTMIACDLGRFCLLATIPACWALHVLTLWQLYAVIFAAGALSIVFNVANSTLFVSIVAAPQYLDGQSLIYGSRAMSFVAGPSVGGLLAQLLTAPFAIVADALSFLGSAFCLSRIRPAEPPASDGSGGVTEGLRFIAGSPVVRASLIGVAVVNLFNLMFSALFTLFAIRTLHVSAGLLGVVLGCGAIGSVLGSVVTKPIAGRFGAGMAYVAGAFMFTAPLALAPLASAVPGHGLWRAVRAGDAVRRGVPVRLRRDGAGHQHRRDLRRRHPGRRPLPGRWRVLRHQLRNAARRRPARRVPRNGTGAAAGAMDSGGRRRSSVPRCSCHRRCRASACPRPSRPWRSETIRRKTIR